MSLLEGSRFVLDCLRLGAPVLDLFLDEGLPAERFKELESAAADAGAEVFHVAPGVMQRLSGQAKAEGAAATVQVPERQVEGLAGATPLVICHGIQNPGNLGAIVRTAAALGAGAVVGSGGTDPFGPKALRGAAGTTFLVPVVRWPKTLPELCRLLADQGYALLLADPRRGASHESLAWREEKSALLLGGEGGGFADEELPEELGIERVRIELRGPVESLNVAVAAGILLDRLLRRG